MRNRDGIFGYPGGLITYLSFAVAALVVVFVTILSAAPSHAQVNGTVDDSINDSFNFDLNIDAQSQECTAIVQQFNNASSGDAVALNKAVAATAAAVDAPVTVVQNCLQARGSISEGVANDQYDDDGDVKNDSTSAAQQQYDSTSSGQEDSCALKLDPKVTVADNGEASENLNVGSGQGGDYRLTYDLGDDSDSLEISVTSAGSGSAVSPITVTDDGSRIVVLDEGSYDITVTPTPNNGGYTVELSRCGASSSDPNNTMNNTYDNGKQLANTGGPTETASFASSSAVLIPVGVALVISGVISALWLRNASNRS